MNCLPVALRSQLLVISLILSFLGAIRLFVLWDFALPLRLCLISLGSSLVLLSNNHEDYILSSNSLLKGSRPGWNLAILCLDLQSHLFFLSAQHVGSRLGLSLKRDLFLPLASLVCCFGNKTEVCFLNHSHPLWLSELTLLCQDRMFNAQAF